MTQSHHAKAVISKSLRAYAGVEIRLLSHSKSIAMDMQPLQKKKKKKDESVVELTICFFPGIKTNKLLNNIANTYS